MLESWQAVDDALSREVNGALNAPIEHSAQLPISLAVQTSINAGHLSTACAFFENYTMSLSDNRCAHVLVAPRFIWCRFDPDLYGL